MPTRTYYDILGLAATAPPEVIRAAYKAFCLMSHPDKTVHLASRERAAHATLFREVQAAYNVLGVPSLKAAYDAERGHCHAPTNPQRSFSDNSSSSCSSSGSSTPSTRGSPVKLTTPEEKASVRAKARQSIEYLREKRAQREREDSDSDVASLQNMAQIWTELADENRRDPAMRAHCTIRIHEYELKIAERTRQREEWLADTARAKKPSPSATVEQPRATTHRQTRSSNATTESFRSATNRVSAPSARRSPAETSTSSTSPTLHTSRAEQRKQAEANKAAAAAARAETRMAEKMQREAARKAHLDKKVAAVRADRAEQRARVEQRFQQESQRIARVRAMVGATPLRLMDELIEYEGTNPHDGARAPGSTYGLNDTTHEHAKGARTKRACSVCGLEHQDFRGWRSCRASTVGADAEELTNNMFFPVV